jgi:hypothetical protein
MRLRRSQHTLTYVLISAGRAPAQGKAKIRTNNANPAVRKQRDEVIRSPRQKGWSADLAVGPVASEGLMEGIADLPVQER